MSSVAPADLPVDKELADGEAAEIAEREPPTKAGRVKKRLTSPWATTASIVIAVIWTIPTFGLLISSFRPAELIRTTGWWTIFQNPGFTLENYQTVLLSSSGSSPVVSSRPLVAARSTSGTRRPVRSSSGQGRGNARTRTASTPRRRSPPSTSRSASSTSRRSGS